MPATSQTSMQPKPLSLIAEVTHRCPLHCLYCSNPLALQPAEYELETNEWKRVFQEAAQLGIVHLHITGGEPLRRNDLPGLISAARNSGLYVNMVSSGIGLTEGRLAELVANHQLAESEAFVIAQALVSDIPRIAFRLPKVA